MRCTTRVIRGILAAGILAAAAAPLGARSQPGPPQIIIESLAGRDSFQLYCSPCHGRAGRGDGPVVPALRTAPGDLSQLARRNGGTFPTEVVRAVVIGVGRPAAAHGSSDMPVWGPLFRAFESDIRVRERVSNLVTFIEGLQQKPAVDPGAQLFRTYCASCHGVNGRGGGPVAEQLRKVPPDLTKYTARNGGVFPSERVRQIVDGRGIAAHGDREMPVWGDAFQSTRAGLTAADAKARIDAIVKFLEGIQERVAH
jgi:mono/diheme cytochrome c family protein